MPTQRFYHIRPKKRAAIKEAILRQLAVAPLEKFSARKVTEELELAAGSFSGYFESREDMVRYILEDYIRYEEKLFFELLEKIRNNAFSEITEIAPKLVDYAEAAGLLPVLKNLFADIKISMNSSFEYIAQEADGIVDKVVPVLAAKIGRRTGSNEGEIRAAIQDVVPMCVLCYRYTLTEVYSHYERRQEILEKLNRQFQMIADGFVMTVRSKRREEAKQDAEEKTDKADGRCGMT